MIATISATTQIRTSPTTDHTFSRTSNMAVGPLPLIPRRSTSASRANSAPSASTPNTIFPVKVTVESPSPPKKAPHPPLSRGSVEDSDTSSSSLSDESRPTITPRARRVRGVRLPAVCPPEESTPTPAVFNAKFDTSKHRLQIETIGKPEGGNDASDNDTPRPLVPPPLVYTPGMSLRASLDAIKTRNLSESHVNSPSKSLSKSAPVEIPPAVERRLVRKKSGEPVKSSLKSTKPIARGSLSVITLTSSSKSEPNTPTHAKAVHFDAQLEHVKLFLAEQKPLAVSRDGSPTEDTSGTDTDFPSFIYGDSSDEKTARKDIVMQVKNMPVTVNLNADVALEELKLSPDATSILGNVRVRNLAFHKWLAVRFTFDSWQTTSEVTAKYLESLDSEFDRFTFTIRLNDLLARIETKTLLLALRYTVIGREIWDNNGTQNYLATFTRTKSKPKAEKTKSDDEESSAGSDMADLKSKLEKVVQGREETGPSFLTHHSRRVPGTLEHENPPVLKTGTSLASRYDFGASLRNPWKPAFSPSPPRHNRNNSYPATSPSSIPWPEKIVTPTTNNFHISQPLGKPRAELGSPRDLDDDHFHPAPYLASDLEDGPFPIPSRDRVIRNHQRGYFDIKVLGASPSVRKTPPGTPRMRSLDDMTPLSSPRFYSFPPVDNTRPMPSFGAGLGLVVTPRAAAHPESGDGGSEQSTPTILSSSSSSRSTSPSPTESFLIAKLTGQNGDELPMSPPADYHQFLDKFCFYTGNESVMDVTSDSIPRTQSASSVEELLANQSISNQSPRLYAFSQQFFSTPTRSSSLEDAANCRSGSSTPTARNFAASDSRSATPIAS